jgi:two-component system cell cycle response regulator DivK
MLRDHAFIRGGVPSGETPDAAVCLCRFEDNAGEFHPFYVCAIPVRVDTVVSPFVKLCWAGALLVQALPSIVIAEPLRDQRELYGDYFAWAGFDVRLAASGLEVVAQSLEARPDVIVTNFILGDCHAPDLCVRLHQHPATSTVPIIVLRTSMGSADIDQAVDAGCAAILTKPVLPEILLSEVQKCLRHSRVLRATATRVRARAARVRGEAQSVLHRSRDVTAKYRRRK